MIRKRWLYLTLGLGLIFAVIAGFALRELQLAARREWVFARALLERVGKEGANERAEGLVFIVLFTSENIQRERSLYGWLYRREIARDSRGDESKDRMKQWLQDYAVREKKRTAPRGEL